VKLFDLARRGPESLRIFCVDPAFDCVTFKLDVGLIEAELCAGSDQNLLTNQIDAGDLLGNRVFNLQTGVHFDEIKLAILIEKFDRSRAQIAKFFDRLPDRFANPDAFFIRKRRRKGFFEHFLVAALKRAIAFAELHHIAVTVGDDLQFDMARQFQIFFKINRIVAKRGL